MILVQASNLMTTIYRALRYSLVLLLAVGLFLLMNVSPRAQSNQRLAPSGHINDFAGVIDAQTKSRLENLLLNLKQKTNVDFYVATVDATGGLPIFDYSRQLAGEWNIGSRNSGSKSLLMVISVGSKSSFTQFSRLIQPDLPDGVLGEMSQRMRAPLSAGRFTEALDNGVHLFVTAVAQKLGVSPEDLETANAAGNTDATTIEETPRAVPVSSADPQQTRPRVVSEESKPEPKPEEKIVVSSEPVRVEEKPAENSPTSQTTPTEINKTESESVAKGPRPGAAKLIKPTSPAKKKDDPPVNDADESEEVELTLTLPLARRAEKLKTFLDTHPNSKSRVRATELLISTHAGLGDQFLKNGDVENGVKQLMLVIDEADATISDQLFTGVIAQIPSNLYLRGQHDAAFKAAQSIETKFASDPKRLLNVAGFYVGLEMGAEATRLAGLAVKLAPDMAEAHRVLAVALHINLQLDEAMAEYKKTVELDPASRVSRSSLANLSRANGQYEESLALYNDLLKSDPMDRSAMAGIVLSLMELGRNEEAVKALDTALATEPRNLALLSGTAYWFAAHANYEKAFELARRAITIEPRYTWAQIALVRSLIGMKSPLGAERAMRFARQYGKFPTLNYELANVLANMGFYDEAAEVLKESFTFNDGEIETNLAGRIPARNANFMDLLAVERRASIYQLTAADTASNSKVLRDLLALTTVLGPGSKPDETQAAKAARDFGSGTDVMRTFRQLYAASRLLRNGVALSTAFELAEEARKGIDAALDTVVATSATQADEYREMRAQAISTGNIPDIANAPRTDLSAILRGRIEDTLGWVLFNQDKTAEAIEHLKKAAAILPNGTPSWRNALWHLGVAHEQLGNNNEALDSYILSYNSGVREPVRRTTIENLYRKINGSLYGLDEKIGPAVLTSGTGPTAAKPSVAESAPVTPQTETPVATTPEPTPTPTSAPNEVVKNDSTPPATSSANTTSAAPAPRDTPISEESLKSVASRVRSNIRITGRIVDANNAGLSNVVVVLISPSGSVIASTTDNEGNYSFTVMPSQKTYRIIPSKDGFAFTPVDKTFAGLIDDQKGIDFAAITKP
jgi:tetratricopeptide (TPR) repeat protein/uncharacterized membrane protein YgcG